MRQLQWIVPDEAQMEQLGKLLLQGIPAGLVIYLQGNLGAGKTTLVRAALRGQGYTGAVKSPTYTLVETYALETVQVAHFDLYRLADPEELEFMGIREYFHSASIAFIEWADKGRGYLPPPDLTIGIAILPVGRRIVLTCHSVAAEHWLASSSQLPESASSVPGATA